MNDALRTLVAVAASQHDVFSLAQARGVGLSDSAIQRRCDNGSFARVGTRTLAFGGHTVSWRGRLHAGLLDLGQDAVVAGRAALCLHGVDGFGEGPLTYLVPRAQRRRRTPGVVHSTPSLSRRDVTTVDGLRCSCAARAILGLLGEASARELERATQHSLRLGLTSVPALTNRFGELRHRGLPATQVFDAILTDAGVQSWLEDAFLGLVKEAGLPQPTLQRVYRRGTTHIARVDFDWHPLPVIVEVGGKRGYLTARERQRQERRRNALQLLGKIVYFFTYEDVTEEPGLVLTTLAQALHRAA